MNGRNVSSVGTDSVEHTLVGREWLKGQECIRELGDIEVCFLLRVFTELAFERLVFGLETLVVGLERLDLRGL